MEFNKIKNWKLNEVLTDIEVIDTRASDFIQNKIEDLGIPPMYNEYMHRGESFIDWAKMPVYYKFFFDKIGMEETIMQWFTNSLLGQCDNIIITYLQEQFVVKLPLAVFLTDWEGFVRSTLYNGLIFSEDYKLIIEFTRDYHFHSNFEIQPALPPHHSYQDA